MTLQKGNGKTKKIISAIAIISIVLAVITAILIRYFDLENESAEQNGYLQIHVIDVGQGDAVLLREPSQGKFVLIDTGPNTAEDELMSYLHRHKVKKLDYVVFSHPDSDHVGNANKLIDNFDIENAIYPNCLDLTKDFEVIREKLEDKGINSYVPYNDHTFDVGELHFTIISRGDIKYPNENDRSLVLKAEYGDNSFIFTGDIEYEAESDILLSYSSSFLKCDFLKVAHHGSATSSSFEFLKALSPNIAVISCARFNAFGHPSKETLERLKSFAKTIYRTDIDKDVVIFSNGSRLWKG